MVQPWNALTSLGQAGPAALTLQTLPRGVCPILEGTEGQKKVSFKE